MTSRKNTAKKSKKQLTQRILETVLMKTAEIGFVLVETLFDFMAHPHAMMGRLDSIKAEEAYWERRRMQRALRDLREQKLIETKKKGDQLRVALTDEGRIRLLKGQICAAPLCTGDECVIVIFDIPETERSVRLLFRRFLKECGFQKLQQSVWACTRAVLPHLREFIQLHHAADWVHVFVARDALSYFPDRKKAKKRWNLF